jgi:hypothetical protein
LTNRSILAVNDPVTGLTIIHLLRRISVGDVSMSVAHRKRYVGLKVVGIAHSADYPGFDYQAI